MKNKTIGVILSVVMTATLLAGCGSSSDDTSSEDTEDTSEEVDEEITEQEESASEEDSSEETSSDEAVTIRFAWWGSQDRHDKTIEAIELYESLNPNVTIEYEYYSYDDYNTKLKTLVASNQVWDVFQMDDMWPIYESKIYPLDEYIDSGIIDVSNISDAYLATTQDPADGSQIGLSCGVRSYGLVFNRSMFEEAGVDAPEEGWTWDDYQTAADAVSEALGTFGSSDVDKFIIGGEARLRQQGEYGQYSFFNDDYTGLGFDDPELLAGFFEMAGEMIQNGSYPDQGAQTEVSSVEGDFIVTGESAMGIFPTNQFPTVYDSCLETQGVELEMTTIPRVTQDGNSGVWIQSAQMLCVSQDSECKDEAAEFINWFTNDVDCNNILEGERGVSINDLVREANMENASDAQLIMYDFVDMISEYSDLEDYVAASPEGSEEIEDAYINYLTEVANEEMTASEAAQKIYDLSLSIFE